MFQNLGIYLRGCDFGMSQHFEHGFNSTPLLSVTVVAKVCRAIWNVKFLPTSVSDLLQIRIHFLMGQYRQ
jgi:hypothetical protein